MLTKFSIQFTYIITIFELQYIKVTNLLNGPFLKAKWKNQTTETAKLKVASNNLWQTSSTNIYQKIVFPQGEGEFLHPDQYQGVSFTLKSGNKKDSLRFRSRSSGNQTFL